ncbi:MFS transporter [Roseivivax sp. CAU 1761]
MLILTVAVSIFAAVTLGAFGKAVAPEFRQRTELLGTIVREDLQRALELGIPLDAVAGLENKVETLVANFPEVRHVAVTSSRGAVLLDVTAPDRDAAQTPWLGFRAWTDTLPILVGNRIVATVTIHGNPRLLEARTFRVLTDIGLIALAIVLLGTEIIVALAARSVWIPRATFMKLLEEQRRGRFDSVMAVPPEGPLAAPAERLNDRAWHLCEAKDKVRTLEVSLPVTARLPVFLLAFGTETTASFLPIMARSAVYSESLPAPFAAAAPLVVYLAAAAVMAPLAGTFVRSIGPRKAFVWAILPIVAGLVVMATAESLTGITLGRMAVGIGYTLAVVSCSVYALRAGGRRMANRTQSSQNTALFGGILAGTVVGGIAAFEAGYAAAILLGALATLATLPVARWALCGPAGRPYRPQAAIGPRAAFQTYAALVVLIAIPASAITAVVIWYLLPLTLAGQGYDTAAIARFVMLYYLPTILLAPLAAQIISRGAMTDRTAMVLGALLSAGVLLGGAVAAVTPAVIALALGIGHALLRAPLYSLVVEAAGTNLHWIDRFRMAERLGAIVAFLIALLTIDATNPAPVFTAFGMLSLSALLAFVMLSPRGRKKEAHEP